MIKDRRIRKESGPDKIRPMRILSTLKTVMIRAFCGGQGSQGAESMHCEPKGRQERLRKVPDMLSLGRTA